MSKTSSDIELAKSLLKGNEVFKGYRAKPYKVSTGSLNLDIATDGGLGSGIHRFCGGNEGGKTCEMLQLMSNFLKSKGERPRKAILINAEYRLTEEKKHNCDFNFVEQDEIENWDEGTCLVLDTNSFETAASVIDSMVKVQDYQYFISVDSVDNLIPDGDADKNFGDSAKVAGGAVIASLLVKRISIPVRKFGHMFVPISQKRAKIPQGMGQAPAEQVNSTGGNALLHGSDYIFEFMPKFSQSNLSKEAASALDISKNKKLGHLAHLKICKSENETSGYTVTYPIKYLDKGGAVNNEREVLDFMKLFKVLDSNSGWMSLPKEEDDNLYSFSKKFGYEIEVGMKQNGDKGWIKFLNENPDATSMFYNYFLDLLA